MKSPDNSLTDFAARLRRQMLDRALIPDPMFESLALELYRGQFAANGPYRRIAEARGARPEAVHRWQDIPAVPTIAFKDLDVSCLPAWEQTAVFHSSGTTSHRPSRHFHHPGSLHLYETSALTWFTEKVLNPDKGIAKPGSGDWSLAILTPPPLQAPHSSLVHMFECVRDGFGAPASAFLGALDPAGAWVLELDATTATLQTSARSGVPLLLLGTAFSLVHLLDHLAARNLCFELPDGSRVMETGGYKGRSRALPQAELHALISRRLGIPAGRIRREYGMSELSSQAYDRAGDGIFELPPWARARVISPETGADVAEGEPGWLRVYDLANTFSVLAVQTEDLAIRRRTGFELIGRAEAAEARGCSLAAA